jgi:hypothetical protein
VRRSDGRAVRAGDEPRYSTPELLALEQRTLDGAVARRNDGVAVIDRGQLVAALDRRPGLSHEQQAMVRALTTDGAGVAVVVGKAGSGKTFALDAAREAWQAAGIRVIGCALAARAAAGLQDGTGIPSGTLHDLLAAARRWQMPATAVLFTTPLGECLRRNAARSRVVPSRVIRAQHAARPDAEQLRAEGWDVVLTVGATTAHTSQLTRQHEES